MNLTRETILSILSSEKPLLENEFAIVQLGLFGSFSSNRQTESSDIDIAFEIREGDAFTLEKNIQLERHFKNLFQRDVDLVRLRYINPVVKFAMEREVIYV
jgi:uncharacterized protein